MRFKPRLVPKADSELTTVTLTVFNLIRGLAAASVLKSHSYSITRGSPPPTT